MSRRVCGFEPSSRLKLFKLIILKGVAVRAFIMAVRAGFEPTIARSKHAVFPNYTNGLQDETHSNYRSYDLYQEKTSSRQSGLRCLFGVVWKRDFRPHLLFYWLMCQPVLAGEFPSQRNRLYIRL